MAPKSPWNKRTPNVTVASRQQAAAEASSPVINYEVVQGEECEVLQAIYMEDYEAVETKGAWSKTTDRSFKLTLRSFSDFESYVVLIVRLTATYPNVLEKRPKQMLGEVMIHTIAGEIQEALEDAVTARQAGTLPSLEEERANAEEVANALAKEAEEAEARRQREAAEEEARMLQQMVDRELQRKERRKASKNLSEDMNSETDVFFDQSANVHLPNGTVEFHAISVVHLVSQARDAKLYLGQPRSSESSLPLVAVKKLVVRKSREDIMQIESTLEAFSKIRNNNILGLLAYRVDRIDDGISQVTLCSEWADRGTLREVLDLGGLHVSKARQFTIELLEGLDFLHHHGLAHGNLNVGSIYLRSSPDLATKLGQLGQWVLGIHDQQIPSKWLSSEAESAVPALRRKADIWNLGVVAVQMFLGLHVTSEYQSPQHMLGRLDVSDAFSDFACKVFAMDSKKRPSAFDLLPSEFLRTDAAVMDEVQLTARKSQRPTSSAIMSPLKRRSRHHSSNIMEPMSRYAADFTELGRLGKGGFGEVVKARNKLDGGVYAVKKVKQAPQFLDQVLSEVMLLNRLNHPYVVRYFSTWVETDISGAVSEEDTTTTATTTTEEAIEEEDEDESSDGPRMDFGGYSTGGLDFVSSSGYPQIEFGDDDSEASSDEATAEDQDRIQLANGSSQVSDSGVSAPRLRKSRSDSRRLPSLLYIQMEYCERQTLRDLIRRGMSTDDSWRCVRQITEGLAHIHSHGIIHRDLKPDNVFIDVAGNPKIGDFGLATTGHFQFLERAGTMSGQSGGGELTRSVGTALYVAPELRSASIGPYNDKVDMYSLGIMFFEMCEEFGTAMERIRALQQIREKEHELPPAYQAGEEKAAQGKLIDCLIAHKPSARPSSTELLRTNLIPVKIEDETIRQALDGLSDPRSPYHQKMMSALFAHNTSDRVKALAWDAKSPSSASGEDATNMRLRSVSRRILEDIFRRHGAEEARRESVFPRSGYYTDPKVVQMLDASGNLLQLPYDLTLPNARQLARRPPAVKRTFVFGAAYRDALTGGPPRVSEEVDFDIAQCSAGDNPALDEAEALKVMDEIACEMPVFASSTNVCFHLNHMAMLDAILEFCRIPHPQHTAVKETISRLGFVQWTWPKVRAELRKFGLPDTTLDDLQQFDFRDSPEKAFRRVQELFANSSPRLRHHLEQGIEALRETLSFIKLFALQRRLYVAPLASVNAKFFEDGMLFQCVLERKTTRIVIAAGGRYDKLIKAHRPNASSDNAWGGAVGVAVGLDPIVAHMVKNVREVCKSPFLKDRKSAEPLAKRCDVLVEAAGTEAVMTVGIRVLISLWANGVSAELAATSNHSSGEMAAEHSLVVAIRHEASNTVRLTITGNNAEELDVPISTLVSRVQQELRDMETSKPRQPAFARQSSHHDANDRKGNVQVLMAQHRSKKSNKFHIVAEAQQKWAEKMETWKEAPILAIETRDEVLESLRGARFSDADSWKKAIQNVQLNERQYLQQVQEILSGWRKKWIEHGEGGREACVFNFRTGGSRTFSKWSTATYMSPFTTSHQRGCYLNEMPIALLIFSHDSPQFEQCEYPIYRNERIDIGRKDIMEVWGTCEQTISTHHLRFRCIMFEDDDDEQRVAPLVYMRVLSCNPVVLRRCGCNSPGDETFLARDSGDILLNHDDELQLTRDISCAFVLADVENLRLNALSNNARAEVEHFRRQYHVTGRVLGSGGQAAVVLAVKQSTKKQLACKIVPMVEKCDRLAREFDVLKDLDHPNIICLEKVFCASYNIYIFSELITGGDLLSFVEQHGPLREAETAAIVRQLLKAVDYLHSKQIVHRDIKPENVLMTSWREGCRVVLTDFGQARRLEYAKSTMATSMVARMQTIVGTYGYIAPELFNHVRYDHQRSNGYTKAVDIWSIGCITATLLTNKLLYEVDFGDGRDQPNRWDLSVLDTDPEWQPIGRKPKSFIAGCLQVEEIRRLTAESALQHDWLTNRHYAAEMEGAYQRAVFDWKPRGPAEDLIEFIDTTNVVPPDNKPEYAARPNEAVTSKHFPGQQVPAISPPRAGPKPTPLPPHNKTQHTFLPTSIVTNPLKAKTSKTPAASPPCTAPQPIPPPPAHKTQHAFIPPVMQDNPLQADPSHLPPLRAPTSMRASPICVPNSPTTTPRHTQPLDDLIAVPTSQPDMSLGSSESLPLPPGQDSFAPSQFVLEGPSAPREIETQGVCTLDPESMGL
ncbi:eIF-2-alpha kinase GCN2-like [Teratosphaeria destructans]|uniref:non-specific serine/threonine protein kinase n=1 Tax=Teratosphaeria destructans TaxID=418781 RepID=A0A9W7W260_9PEZI|nr:eIF-2-alpha kinase GCN2-like [Teratosphaeria destructans]